MAGLSTTMRRILCQKKPPVRCNMKANKNTNNKNWPELIHSVVAWDDFKLENLNESFGHVLDFPILGSLNTPLLHEALPGVEINAYLNINHLISWSDGMAFPTLDVAKGKLGLHSNLTLRSTYTSADKSAIAKIPGAKSAKAAPKVDHVIYVHDHPTINLVVGIGRPSSMWSGERLLNQSGTPVIEHHLPLRQLAALCEAASTLYGYIQSNEELVVCCFSKEGETWRAAVMPIPWTRSGIDLLITDLALWWLSMLVMSDPHNRKIMSEGDMVKINAWEVYFDDEKGCWKRRHRYSKVKESVTPPPPANSPAPSIGDVTAFELDMDLDTVDWFSRGDDPANDGIANPANFEDANGVNLGQM